MLKRGDGIGGKGVRDEEALQRHQENLRQVGGGADPETAKNDQDDDDQDRVGLLQDPQEDGVKPLLLLAWLWAHGGGLPGGQTEAGAAEGAATRGMLRVPVLGSRGVTSVPQERISPGMTTSRGLCVVHLFGRKP